MCYRLPGNRCSPHAKASLIAAQERLSQLSPHSSTYEDQRASFIKAKRNYYSTSQGMKELEGYYSNCMKVNDYAGAEKVSKSLNEMHNLSLRRAQGLHVLTSAEKQSDDNVSSHAQLAQSRQKIVAAAIADLGNKPDKKHYQQYMSTLSQKLQSNLDFLKKEKSSLEKTYAEHIDDNTGEAEVFLSLLMKNRVQQGQCLALANATSEQLKTLFVV